MFALTPIFHTRCCQAGAGGDEAAIWAADLSRMYTRYAGSMGWKTQLVSSTAAEGQGFKEVIMQVRLVAFHDWLLVGSQLHAADSVGRPAALRAAASSRVSNL